MAVLISSWQPKFIHFVYVFFFLSSFVISITDGGNTLGPNQVLNIEDTLISDNKRFELGFFYVTKTWNDTNQSVVSWYLGIWYYGIKPLTVVWIGNRDQPLRFGIKLLLNSGGDLLIKDEPGNNVILLSRNLPFWSKSRSSGSTLVLLDSGNLVLTKNGQNSNPSDSLWQSFDSPTDTLLPGMNLGWDLKSRKFRFIAPWKASDDPGTGDFFFGIKSPKSPQLWLENNGVTQSRWGPWDGKTFSGIDMKQNNTMFRLVYNYSTLDQMVYFTFEMLDDSVLLRLVVNTTGDVGFMTWYNSSMVWVPILNLNKDGCDRYGSCGSYGVCYAGDTYGCRCLKGFGKSLDGCTRHRALNCGVGDGFVKSEGLKLPDNFNVLGGLKSLDECGDYCLKKCDCMAYTSQNVYGNGSVCVVWTDIRLLDMKDSIQGGDELFIRVSRDELDSNSRKIGKKSLALISSLLVVVIIGLCLLSFAKNHFVSLAIRENRKELQNGESVPAKSDDDDKDIPLFDTRTISAATDNFSLTNKIGQGGFGPVYKGALRDGRKIAVKRLSEHSSQGLLEFKNEVNVIAHLQHRNLVKILGCCIEGAEKMLIYELMPNKSLDKFLFEPAKENLLPIPWGKRLSIVKGIARALDYLHFGSRLRIVHRDLKASNILLDDEMSPKISDFGLARNFDNDKEEITKRVIGTHGYMSPEYVMDGQYSIKSDVYSFGVLVLEIISGKRNWGFQHPDHDFNLLGHAWKLRSEGREMELIDPLLGESVVEIEIVRCIHIGLLCVQHSQDERPIMGHVVSMLERVDVSLPDPEEPGFFSRRPSRVVSVGVGWSNETVNGLTITDLTARE